MRDYKALIQPLRSKRTFEEVSNRIKELIFNGDLKPGDKLPSETALAALFGVGRQSVREALRILERSGLITIKAGVKGGPIIEDTVHRKIAGLFLDASRFNRVSLEDYSSALTAIDVSLMDFIFGNADEGDVSDLRNNIAEARRKLDLNTPADDENIDFHRLLAKATKNYVFRIIMESILAVLYDFRSKLTPFGNVDQSRQITKLHEEVIEAIMARNKTRIAELIEKDMAIVKQILTSDTGKRNAPGGGSR